jgi:hypothetical protein
MGQSAWRQKILQSHCSLPMGKKVDILTRYAYDGDFDEDSKN